ncbi:glycosyltransferase [Nitratireductor sp. XY-223]|uniref:glycosyltransferase n=1 Tax=Nitratireductor sp. XY-223 TaxID=2561926 RepID=UPI00145B6639|nr:glycosyltransferase [Nitratireductor sp. XY-223]
MNGVTGAFAKTVHIVRSKGIREAVRRIQQSLRLHARLLEVAPTQKNNLTYIESHNEYLSILGPRAKPRPARFPNVVIISDTTLEQCHRYRIENKIAFLRGLGVRATFVHAEDIPNAINAIQFSSAVIFYRLSMNDAFMNYCSEAARLGVPTLYDIDDPMFDRDIIIANANVSAIDPHTREALLRDSSATRDAMVRCDFMLASTPALAEIMCLASGGKPAFVWRNVADKEALELGDEIYCANPEQQSSAVRIGYFSGSLAHEADFDVAAPAIARFMKEREDVNLLLFGHVNERSLFDDLGGRITNAAVADYSDYINAIAGCDFVVVPLVDNEFNRCKSIVRYIDAALVRVPVIASRVGDYAALVRNGETGWLVSEEEWLTALEQARDDASERQQMGLRARAFVESEYAVGSYRPDLGASLNKALLGYSCAPSRH